MMIYGTAPCGIKYGIKNNTGSVAYCALSISCGTRSEDALPMGTAHFTEHGLFKGTLHRRASSINSRLDRLGGELNAFTTKEEIVLHATVLAEDLWKAVSLLTELATEATFPEDEIETERRVILDEIRSYLDSPADDIYDRFESMLFKGHPLERLILGTEDSVSLISCDHLRAFVRERFIPEAMALTIVAPYDCEKLRDQLMRHIGKVFGNEAKAATQTTVNQDLLQKRKFITTLEKDNHEANAVIGGYAPSLYSGQKRIAAILMNNILGGPAANSILNNVLREKNGWVYAVESSYSPYSDSGIIAVSLGCDKENIEKCCRCVEKEIQKLQDTPLSPNRLNAAKKQMLGQMAISSDNSEVQCLSMGKSMLAYGHILPEGQNVEMIKAVTAEEVMTAARECFAPDYTSKLIYL